MCQAQRWLLSKGAIPRSSHSLTLSPNLSLRWLDPGGAYCLAVTKLRRNCASPDGRGSASSRGMLSKMLMRQARGIRPPGAREGRPEHDEIDSNPIICYFVMPVGFVYRPHENFFPS